MYIGVIMVLSVAAILLGVKIGNAIIMKKGKSPLSNAWMVIMMIKPTIAAIVIGFLINLSDKNNSIRNWGAIALILSILIYAIYKTIDEDSIMTPLMDKDYRDKLRQEIAMENPSGSAILSSSGETNKSICGCPFRGRVIVDKDIKALGFDWKTKETAFIITDDWRVKGEDQRGIGWIDVDGYIHLGSGLLESVDPNATLGTGKTNLNVKSGYMYNGYDRIGELVNY